jgi:hypothetical protein
MTICKLVESMKCILIPLNAIKSLDFSLNFYFFREDDFGQELERIYKIYTASF